MNLIPRPDFTPLLITGCYRCGTTVVEKLLNQHPGIAVASQPFPILYALTKQRFLDEKGLTRRYPLGHLFLETEYTEQDFYRFLDRYVLHENDILDFHDQMDRYEDGLWTPEVRTSRGRIDPGTFWEVYGQLMQFLESRFPRASARYRGTKEVLVEEYASYFLGQGAAVVIVIRDPRAMIASLNFHERRSFAGANRPVLFSLRAWRKSVAIGLAVAESKKGMMVRYEDIVLHAPQTLARIGQWLDLTPFSTETLAGEIIDQWGKPWQGNSSFAQMEGISSLSVDAWRDKLPHAVTKYVENICLPEMRLLGYSAVTCSDFDANVVRDFREPFTNIHTRFPRDYSYDPKRICQELERVKRLGSDLSTAEQRKWFVNETAFRALRGNVDC